MCAFGMGRVEVWKGFLLLTVVPICARMRACVYISEGARKEEIVICLYARAFVAVYVQDRDGQAEEVHECRWMKQKRNSPMEEVGLDWLKWICACVRVCACASRSESN